jgi:hypothetical protein
MVLWKKSLRHASMNGKVNGLSVLFHKESAIERGKMQNLST